MITVIDRYLARAAWRGIALVLVGLVIVMSLAALVGQLNDIGDGRYALADAVRYVIFTMPQRALDLLPISAFMGAIIGLGGLAAGRELSVMRASGTSPMRLACSIALAAIPVVALGIALAQWVVPDTSREAERERRIALSGRDAVVTDRDLWFRNGPSFVRVGVVRENGDLRDVQLFAHDAADRFLGTYHARRAKVSRDGAWTLYEVRHDAADDLPRTDELDSYPVPDPLTTANLELMFTRGEILSLTRMRERLREPEAPARLARTYWSRIGGLVLVAALALLALPFALGGTSEQSLARRLVLGAVLGALVHVLVQAFNYLGEILELNAMLVGLAPAALAFALGLKMLGSVR